MCATSEVLPAACRPKLRPCATSRPSTSSCDWWRVFAVRLGSGGGPPPSIDVAHALLEERRELTKWATRCYRPPWRQAFVLTESIPFSAAAFDL